ERLLAEARAKLLAARLRRVPPVTDDKVLTGWKGLMITGLGGGGRAAARPRADFVLTALRAPDGAGLLRTYKEGRAKLPAPLDDYAFVTEGLYHLAGATGELSYLDQAAGLLDQALLQMYEPATHTFYLSPPP